MDRLYLVVRADLPAGAQISQIVHAKDAFQDQWPTVHAIWRKTSNTIVVLTAPNEEALTELQQRACDMGYACAGFLEPDFNDALTALCLEPAAFRLVKSLPTL